MPCPTFKRFPRTTQEAYGPYTSREVHPMEDDKPSGYPLLWWAAVTIIAALAVLAIVVDNLPAGAQ